MEMNMSQPKQYWNEANAKAWEREMMKPQVWTIKMTGWDNPKGEWRIKDSEGPGVKDKDTDGIPSVKVVEYSAYQKTVDALKEASDTIHSEFCGHRHAINCIRLTQLLQDLGELDAPGKGE